MVHALRLTKYDYLINKISEVKQNMTKQESINLTNELKTSNTVRFSQEEIELIRAVNGQEEYINKLITKAKIMRVLNIDELEEIEDSDLCEVVQSSTDDYDCNEYNIRLTTGEVIEIKVV